MGEFDSTVTPQPPTYVYAFTLPGSIADVITNEVRELAGEDPKRRTYVAWAHDLPVWTVAEQDGSRTNTVRVEAVLELPQSQTLLLFSMDAYEDVAIDIPSSPGAIRRTVASATDVSRLTIGLPIEKAARANVRDLLRKTLASAATLKVSEARVISYPSPFRGARAVG